MIKLERNTAKFIQNIESLPTKPPNEHDKIAKLLINERLIDNFYHRKFSHIMTLRLKDYVTGSFLFDKRMQPYPCIYCVQPNWQAHGRGASRFGKPLFFFYFQLIRSEITMTVKRKEEDIVKLLK
jgi:hypothetical protein